MELKRLEKEGILHKVKFIDWAMPIVPVAKSNSTVRICGDYKTTVNPQLQYPLPHIDHIFAKLAGGQKFTKIDLRQAYHQMEVEEESQEYLTINTHQGLYRYNHLVFGITSAPANLAEIYGSNLRRGASCILDDMIIAGKDDKEHLEYLEEGKWPMSKPQEVRVFPDKDHLPWARSRLARVTQDSRENSCSC